VSDQIPVAVRRAVEARSGGVCEGCGKRRATEKHHRLYRSRGGLHVVENLLDLCGWGNHTGDHGVAHTKTGEDRGWSIRSGGDPLVVPVQHARFGLVRLTAEGGWEPVSGSGTDAVSSAWDSSIPMQTEVAMGDWS